MPSPTDDVETLKQTIKIEALARRAQAGPPSFPAAQAALTRRQILRSKATDEPWKMKIKLAILRTPGLGYCVRKLASYVNLPKKFNSLHLALQQLNSSHQEFKRSSELEIIALKQRVESLEQLAPQIPILLNHNHQVFGKIAVADERIAALWVEMRRMEMSRSYRENPSHQTTAAPSAPSQQPSLDDFYFRFEEHFRGSRAEVSKRLAVYETYIKLLKEQMPTALPVLDVGCGRGEWLQILQSHGVPAQGLDLNHRMVNECQQRGLNVAFIDALSFLKSQAPHSLSALTGFHIVEHLEFHDLMTLLLEAYRVIAPGGFVIFETPNPENIFVGACNFYTDPTHRNPIPPATLNFMLSEVGFTRQDCLRLGASSSEGIVQGQATDVAPDYAIIGFKDALAVSR